MTMAEYIEREAAMEFARLHYCKDCNSYNGIRCGSCGFDDAMLLIEDAPAADVVEARPGKWVWDVETHGDPMYGVDEDFGYRCSECQVWADEYGVDGDIYGEPPTHILHYCPNCGAKMGGKGD